jgi:putative acyl-CoA dehydrogenase
VLRAAMRSPDSLAWCLAELDAAKGADQRLDDAIEAASRAIEHASAPEFEARRIVERLAVAWAGALLVRLDEQSVFDAHAVSRLSGDHGSLYGTLPATASVDALVERAVPGVDT